MPAFEDADTARGLARALSACSGGTAYSVMGCAYGEPVWQAREGDPPVEIEWDEVHGPEVWRLSLDQVYRAGVLVPVAAAPSVPVIIDSPATERRP